MLDWLERKSTNTAGYAVQRIYWYLMWRWLGIKAHSAMWLGFDIPRIIGCYTMSEARQIHERLHGPVVDVIRNPSWVEGWPSEN